MLVALLACGDKDPPLTAAAAGAPVGPFEEAAATITRAQPQAPPDTPADAPPTSRELRLQQPPHPIPLDAPHAVVWIPPRPRAIFVFLHGWNGCARALASAGPAACRDGEATQEGWDLLNRFQTADRNAAFVIAQLAWRRRTGAPGRFRQKGYAARWLRSLGADEDLPVVLLAHSAGFATALAIARHGGLDDRLRAIVLFDALYGGTEGFLRWVRAAPERRLISYTTRSGRPARQQRRLQRRAAATAVTVAHDLWALDRAQVITLTARTGHTDVPHRYLPAVVRALTDALP